MSNISDNVNINDFGFANAQNISEIPYPLNINANLELFNLTIPKKLQEITQEDIINNNIKIDENWILTISEQLNALIKDIPPYPIPPLFNNYSNLSDEKTKKFIDKIISDNYANDQVLQKK